MRFGGVDNLPPIGAAAVNGAIEGFVRGAAIEDLPRACTHSGIHRQGESRRNCCSIAGARRNVASVYRASLPVRS